MKNEENPLIKAEFWAFDVVSGDVVPNIICAAFFVKKVTKTFSGEV